MPWPPMTHASIQLTETVPGLFRSFWEAGLGVKGRRGAGWPSPARVHLGLPTSLSAFPCPRHSSRLEGVLFPCISPLPQFCPLNSRTELEALGPKGPWSGSGGAGAVFSKRLRLVPYLGAEPSREEGSKEGVNVNAGPG